jgi:hypothetical protein
MVFVGLNGTTEELSLDKRNHHFIVDEKLIQRLGEYVKLDNEQLLDVMPPFYSVTFPSAKDPSYAARFPGDE